jgi:hypothetical protein
MLSSKGNLYLNPRTVKVSIQRDTDIKKIVLARRQTFPIRILCVEDVCRVD